MSLEGDLLPTHHRRQEKPTERRVQKEENAELPEWYRQLEAAGKIQPRISRRSFLAGAGAFAAAAAVDNVTKYSRLARWLDDQFVGQYDYDEAVKDAKAYLKERYKIDLFVGDDGDEEDIKANATTLERYRDSLRVIIEELAKYPPEMIHAIGEARGFQVRIAESIYVRMNPQSNIGIRAGGVAPWLRDKRPARILLDADQPVSFQARAVHHELNHRAANKWENAEERDKKWIAFHDSVTNTPYRPKRKGIDIWSVPPEGYFVAEYAAQAPIEDEAVCAEFMMIPAFHVRFVDQWRNLRDPAAKEILARKYLETKKNYRTWSGGKIDDAFWEKLIQAGRRQQEGS